MKEWSSTCFYCERTIFNFLQVYIGWSWFHVSSFCLGFWVSIRVTVCATCTGHILCFMLHMLWSWKNLMIFKAIDFALVVGFGFWVVNFSHFFVWFLGFCITWFQFLHCAQSILHVGSSYEFYIGHLVSGICIICTLGYGFWILGFQVINATTPVVAR